MPRIPSILSTALALFAASLSSVSFGQHGRCAAESHLDAQLDADTAFARSFFAFEAAMAERRSASFRSGEQYTLPVVVHILHDGDGVGEGANISEAQVMSAIAALNADFDGSQGGSDVSIDFELASRDPDGQPTNGIVRLNVADIIPEFAEHGIVTDNNSAPTADATVKALSHWPETDYINIYVASKLNGGTSPLGYAYLPPITGVLDGIVVHHQVFGVGEDFDLMNNFDLNRTLTHEVGHYLGLYHTFHFTQDCGEETNCAAQGDRVCDTPPTTGTIGCNAMECEGTMVENFMDYGHDGCMTSFTDGQRDRMRDALLEHRASLLESVGTIPVVATDGGVASIQGIAPVGCNATHAVDVALQNFGSSPLTEAQVHFSLDGGPHLSVAWSGELLSGQSTLVSLPELSAGLGVHTLTVWSTISEDGYGENDTQTLDFTVTEGAVLSMDIQFDFLPYGITWEVENDDTGDIFLEGGDYVNSEFSGAFITSGGCATPGCYTLTVEDLFGNGMHYEPQGWYALSDGEGNVLGTAGGDFGSSMSHSFCVDGNAVAPCPDENGNGVCDEDEGDLIVVIEGCMDPSSCTYNAEANTDDGSCDYLDALGECGGACEADLDGDGVCDTAEIPGCTDATACNFDETATEENGGCEYAAEGYDCEGNLLVVIEGCTDPESCTYDAEANTDDGSCDYLDALGECGGECEADLDGDGVCDDAEIPGCTDATACNFDEAATEENGGCEYAAEGYDCEGNPLVSSVSDLETSGAHLTAFPNPATSGQWQLTGLPSGGRYEVVALDLRGRDLDRCMVHAASGAQGWTVRPALNLSAGLVILRVRPMDGTLAQPMTARVQIR